MSELPKPYYQDEAVTIYHGDCREILPGLPKVNLVLTDPPYLKEYLWTYSLLSEYGAKLLPEGRFCFAYGAVEHMRERLSRMEEYLQFHWVAMLIHNGGWPRMWNKHIMSSYKPVFIYSNGPVPKPVPWMGSVYADRVDKRFHKWGQGVGYPIKVIEQCTTEGETILDPFVGGGQMLFAAKITGRKAIGVEIDESAAEIAAKRMGQGVLL